LTQRVEGGKKLQFCGAAEVKVQILTANEVLSLEGWGRSLFKNNK